MAVEFLYLSWFNCMAHTVVTCHVHQVETLTSLQIATNTGRQPHHPCCIHSGDYFIPFPLLQPLTSSGPRKRKSQEAYFHSDAWKSRCLCTLLPSVTFTKVNPTLCVLPPLLFLCLVWFPLSPFSLVLVFALISFSVYFPFSCFSALSNFVGDCQYTLTGSLSILLMLQVFSLFLSS